MAIMTCNCGARVQLPEGAAGRYFRCPRCKNEMMAPSADPFGAPAPTPTAPAMFENAAAPPPPPPPATPVFVPPVRVGGSGSCAICQTAIARTERIVNCPACEQVHHEECWRDIGGCSTYGCERAPAVEKAAPAEPHSAWGDVKNCPACGEQIKSIALRCRYCNTAFNTVDPLTAQDLRRGAHREQEFATLRTNIIVLFIMSLSGCLAPLSLVISVCYFVAKGSMLPKAGPVHLILAYFTLGLSTLYTLLLFLLILYK